MTKARDLANVISGSGTLNANVIPALPASKITSGTFADARLSSSSVTQHVDLTSLSASNLTSGTVPSARLSLSASDVPDLATSKITSGTFADARLSASSVTQHVDLSNLNASNLTSGSIPNARVPSGAVTQHVSAVTQQTGSWSPSLNVANMTFQTFWARYFRVGNHCTVTALMRSTARTSRDTNETAENQISGLPFTSANTGNYAGFGIFTGGVGSRVWVKANVSYMNISEATTGDPRVQENTGPHYRGTKRSRQTLWDHLYSSTGGEGHFYFTCTYQV